jgi:hypothetical protein
MRPFHDTAFTVINRLFVQRSQERCRHWRRMWDWYRFRFSIPSSNVFETTVRDSDMNSLEKKMFITFYVHCACGFAHSPYHSLRHFRSFRMIGWVSICTDYVIKLEVRSLNVIRVLNIILHFANVVDTCALITILHYLSRKGKRSQRLRLFLDWYGFGFCTPFWTVSEITRDSHVFSTVRTFFSTFDVHCASGSA